MNTEFQKGASYLVEYECRDIGYGIDAGLEVGVYEGLDAGRHMFALADGKVMYLFDDEIVSAEQSDTVRVRLSWIDHIVYATYVDLPTQVAEASFADIEEYIYNSGSGDWPEGDVVDVTHRETIAVEKVAAMRES